jgi:membrane-associated phospholipid phosphatase
MVALVAFALFQPFATLQAAALQGLLEQPGSTTSLPTPDAQVATGWFDLYLHLVQSSPGFSPPVAARAFGYAGVALYETVVPGFSEYQSLVGQLNDLDKLPRPSGDRTFDWEIAANAALARMARKLFANTSSENLAAIQALEEQWNETLLAATDPATHARSVRYGHRMANAIFAWSKTDGGHEGYSRNFPADYTPPSGAGMWLPTLPQEQPALQPTWGENRPFVLASGNACPPGSPLPYSEAPGSTFYEEGMEVYTVSQQRTAEQESIARFWSDDPGETVTPPGHSISIATQVLRQENASLILAAETYARVGIAVADSFIGCWNAKYQYNLLRPITYIRDLIDPEWMPLLNTPPFPEYPSGHSVQSAAVATVLTELFGEEYIFVDHTHDGRGLPARSFVSFAGFAEEAALSRLYGGIHYRRAIEEGLAQGACIGATVNELAFRR